MSKILKITIFLFSIIFCFSNPKTTEALVLYENNFDDKPDWVSPPEGTAGLAYTHEEAKSIGFSEVMVGSNKITGEGHDLFEISKNYAKGDSGKGLVVRVESEEIRQWRGGRLALHFADSDNFDQSVVDSTGYEEIYISYWVKWSADWDWGSSSHYIKMYRGYLNVDYQAVWDTRDGLSNSDVSNNFAGNASVIDDWGGGLTNYLPTHRSDEVGATTIGLQDYGCSWSDYFSDAGWHHVVHHVKLNDVGESNAVQQIYIDGELAGSTLNNSKSAYLIRSENIKLNDILLFDNHYIECSTGECPKEQEYYIDNLRISTLKSDVIDDENIIVRGDVDQNSSINTIDALLTLRNSLGLDMPNVNWQISDTTGDVDCDGSSNSIDAVLLLRYSLGLDMSGTAWCE